MPVTVVVGKLEQSDTAINADRDVCPGSAVIGSESMAPQASAAETPLGGDDERVLIEAAKADPRRFGELYERNFDRVYAYVARRSGGREAAEDLTAEVFHHALAHLGRFEWRGVPFAAWLMQIARNASPTAGSASRASAASPPPSPPTTALAEADRRAVLAQLVGALPQDQQRVVLERFVEGRSVREIAEALGRTEGAVKQLQFRALQSLRARWKATA